MADRIPKTGTVALVGSESLIGREIRDVFETSHFPARLSLIASGADEAGVLTELEGERTEMLLEQRGTMSPAQYERAKQGWGKFLDYVAERLAAGGR